MAKHLWETDHPYYCSEGNFYHRGCWSEYRSWADFMAEEGDADPDLNLVFRWDWHGPMDDETWEYGPPGDDPYYRDCKLKLFYMGQRKAASRSVTVDVCAADEEAVRAWLQPRWELMRKLWAPLSGEVE